MKAKVFFNDKLLTKVNINNKDEIPEMGQICKMDHVNYYVYSVDIIWSPDYAINITVKECTFTELG